MLETDEVIVEFTTGCSSYFMGDRNAHDITSVPNPAISSRPAIVIRGSGISERNQKDTRSPNGILREHGVILVSWEYASPIVNSFNE